jgi:hypothetical protein
VNSNPDIRERGIGYFLINIKGRTYGVKREDATALACSYDSVL